MSLEASLPKHRGGLLDGLPDWSKVESPRPTTKEEEEEELREVERIVDRMRTVIFPKVYEKRRERREKADKS